MTTPENPYGYPLSTDADFVPLAKAAKTAEDHKIIEGLKAASDSDAPPAYYMDNEKEAGDK